MDGLEVNKKKNVGMHLLHTAFILCIWPVGIKRFDRQIRIDMRVRVLGWLLHARGRRNGS